MLTTNLHMTTGLFNSSVGTVVDIIYEDGRNPTLGLPYAVMVEFVKYVGPPFIHDRPMRTVVVPTIVEVHTSHNA